MRSIISASLFVSLLNVVPVVRAQVATSSPSQSQSSAQLEIDLAEAGKQHALAVQLFNAKKYEEALTAAKRALELREKSLGAEHYLTRTSLYNLAQIYLAKQDYEQSLKAFRRLLPVQEKVLKPGSDETIKTLERIATLSAILHKPDDVEKTYKRILELRESSSGADSPQTARALYRLATFYHLTAHGEQAKPLYRRAISIWEKSAGSETSEYVEALERYSCLLRKDDHEQEAEELERRAGEVERRKEDKGVASSADSEIEIRGGVLNGKAISRPVPSYPEAARQAREQGAVVVRVMVDETGRVIMACAISGARGLRDESERTAYAWRFTPTLLSGVPVKVTGLITFNFNLQ
jgi:TonB family protein